MNNVAQYDVVSIRNDFPILGREVHGKPLVYLDNAASSQRPAQVINAVGELYGSHYSNVHRGVHQLSQESSTLYEDARVAVCGFINAACVHEVVFTRGTTESINLVAQSYARPRLQKGDEILITHMEHHSNIVPWQIVCEQTGAELKVVPISDTGDLEMGRFTELLSERTKLVSVVHVSNALGTVNPVKKIIDLAHAINVPVLIDGAQAVPHIPVDVQALDADFFAFSGHKVYGPTGIGVLYGKEKLLNEMPPYQGGGDMILSVSFEATTYNSLPYKFEAGTPNIAGAVRPVWFHSCWMPCIRTTSAPCSMPRGWRSAPVTTVRSRSWSATECRPLRVPRLQCITPSMKLMSSWKLLKKRLQYLDKFMQRINKGSGWRDQLLISIRC